MNGVDSDDKITMWQFVKLVVVASLSLNLYERLGDAVSDSAIWKQLAVLGVVAIAGMVLFGVWASRRYPAQRRLSIPLSVVLLVAMGIAVAAIEVVGNYVEKRWSVWGTTGLFAAVIAVVVVGILISRRSSGEESGS